MKITLFHFPNSSQVYKKSINEEVIIEFYFFLKKNTNESILLKKVISASEFEFKKSQLYFIMLYLHFVFCFITLFN